MGLALVYLARNDATRLEQTLDELAEFARQVDNPLFWRTNRSFVARIRLYQGDVETAIRESQGDDTTIQTDPLPFVEHMALTRVRILLGRGRQKDLQQALALLDRWQPVAETTHNTLRLIEILALRALACHQTGQPQAALDWLAQAVTLARPGQLVRTFVDLGSTMAGLLKQLERRGTERDYIAQLLAAWPGSDNAAPHLPPGQDNIEHPLETLTQRELEILELLQQRLSNKEIAATLFISPFTVQRHASTIYQKLGVKNRRQAVLQAVARGILPAE